MDLVEEVDGVHTDVVIVNVRGIEPDQARG